MHPPRRFRRPLLLPPGWLALEFLVLLSCLSLVPHWRQLRLPNVLQVTMPRLQPTPEEWRLYNKGMPYKSAELASLRPWHTVDFTGQPLHDFLATATIEKNIASIKADSSHASGVRLLAGATYASVVKALDIMNYSDQKKYWLAIRQRPVTLYAITSKELPRRLQPPIFSCGFQESYFTPEAVEPAWLTELKSLGRPTWQPLVLMLAVVGIISLLRLAPPAQANHS